MTRKFLVLLVLLVATSFACAADFTLTFTNNATVPVDFVVEEKKLNDTWTVVATAATSPIRITDVAVGTHTYRVRARELANIQNISGPTNEVSGLAAPQNPSNLIVITVSVPGNPVPPAK